MSGKKETTLEKILKPIRINPVGIGLTAIGLTSFAVCANDTFNALDYEFNELDYSLLSVIPNIVVTSLGLGLYSYSLKRFKMYRSTLSKSDLKRSYAKINMTDYCNRQPLYVASIETNKRAEINKFIEETPSNEKRFSFIPHF